MPAAPLGLLGSSFGQRTPAGAYRVPRVEWLHTVHGMIVYDLSTAPVSGGGTRLASDVTEAETCLLARAMSYKHAVLGLPLGGAKIGLRASPGARADVIERYRLEIAERLASGVLMTGPDLGTSEADFAGLPTPGGPKGIGARAVDGMPVEEQLTGYGVVCALTTALGGDLEGRTVALEGFGKMGFSIARELSARGGRVVAISTLAGCSIAREGSHFSLDQLSDARAKWGDDLVVHLGVRTHEPAALWRVPCDALIPGARTGVLDDSTAAQVVAHTVMPVANAPYTAGGLDALRDRGVVAHADFVASSGGAMTYLSPRVSRARSIDQARSALADLMGEIVADTLEAPGGPYAGAVRRAERFMATWLPPSDRPARPPLA